MAKLQTLINSEYKWYAIYARRNHEKKVEQALTDNNIKVFLPKRKVLRTWSDRKKWVEEPVFRPYVFVNVSNKEYFRVLQLPSVLNYICFQGHAAQISDKEINIIKKIFEEEMDIEVTNHKITTSMKVKIDKGILYGYCGETIKRNGKTSFIINIDQLGCSILVNIDQSYLNPL